MNEGYAMRVPVMPEHATTKVLASRYARPYCVANRADLDAFKALGCEKCGYKGEAVIISVPEGFRRPSSSITSSRASFLEALKHATRSCWNCSAGKGRSGWAARLGKPKLFVPVDSLTHQQSDQIDRSVHPSELAVFEPDRPRESPVSQS